MYTGTGRGRLISYVHGSLVPSLTRRNLIEGED